MNESSGRPFRPAVRARIAVAIAGTLVAAVGCGFGGTPAQLDARFVQSMRADGHDVPQGAEGETTLVAAARKICERRTNHRSLHNRQQTALTPQELDAVSEAFSGDARRFASLALATYCPS